MNASYAIAKPFWKLLKMSKLTQCKNSAKKKDNCLCLQVAGLQDKILSAQVRFTESIALLCKIELLHRLNTKT